MVALVSTIASPFFAYALRVVCGVSATPFEKGNKNSRSIPAATSTVSLHLL
jgi:hypothetical protein